MLPPFSKVSGSAPFSKGHVSFLAPFFKGFWKCFLFQESCQLYAPFLKGFWMCTLFQGSCQGCAPFSKGHVNFSRSWSAISNLSIPFLKGCDHWKKRKLTAVSNLTIPFSRVVTQKNWKKRNLTAVSNLTIPFLKGCDPKELQEKKHPQQSQTSRFPFSRVVTQKKWKKNTCSNLKPHHSLSQGL